MSWMSDFLRASTQRRAIEASDIYKEEEPQGFMGGVMSGLIGTGEGLASFVHADDLANSLEEYRLENYTPSKPVERDFTSLEYWANPNGARYDLGNIAGSSLPSAVLGIATGGIGSAAGLGSAAARGASAVASTLGRRALGATTQNAIKRFVPEAVGSFSGSLVDSASEGGNARMQALEQGLPNANQIGWDVFKDNIGLNTATNMLEWKILGRGLFNLRGTPGEGALKRVTRAPFRAAPAIGANALQEGAQELAQQTISDSALGNPVGDWYNPSTWTQDQWESAILGGIGGGLFGAGPAGVRALRSGEETNTPTGDNTTSKKSNLSIDEFMAKVGMQETGGDGYTTTNKDSGAYGKYQIMPENWQPWVNEARAAGVDVGSGDRSDPKSQEAVAKFKMEQYRDLYGDEGALVAWYSGPANAERWANGESTDINGRPWDAPQGEYPSIKSYVESTLNQSASPGSGYSDSFNTDDFSLDLKNEIIDFANDKANNSTDPADINFFEDKTVSDLGSNKSGARTFVPTDENIKQVIRQYPRDFFNAQIRSRINRGVGDNLRNIANRNGRQGRAVSEIPRIEASTEQLERARNFINRTHTNDNFAGLADLMGLERERLAARRKTLQEYQDNQWNNENNLNEYNKLYEEALKQIQGEENSRDRRVQAINDLKNRRNSPFYNNGQEVVSSVRPLEQTLPYKRDNIDRARAFVRSIDDTAQKNAEQEQNVSNVPEEQQETSNVSNEETISQEEISQPNIAEEVSPEQEETTQENKSTTPNKTEQKKEENVSTENKQRSPSDIQKEAYSKAYDKITNAHNQFERNLITRDEAVRLMNNALTDFRNSAYITDARRDEQLSRYIDSLTHDMDKEVEKVENENTESTDEALNRIKDPEVRKELAEKLKGITDKYKKYLNEMFTPQGRKRGLGFDDIIAGSAEERLDAIAEAERKDKAKGNTSAGDIYKEANDVINNFQKKDNAVEKTSEKTDNEGSNTNKEANNNGIYDEEQNRRRDTSNGREQSRGTGENEEEWGPSQADTREDRSAGQSARRPDADTDAGLSSNGRLSGTEQTENGSRNDSVGNDERKVEPLTSETVEKVSTQPALVNYRMSDSDNVGEGGKDTRYKNNIKAIKLLKQLEVEGRKATPTEQKVLAKYSGWGGLTSAFSDEKTNNELKELLSDEEYNAAKSSILSAYYTAPNVVKAIWKIADKLGFKGGRVLEPSMGVGNFFGLMPNKIMNNSNLTGVELDKISGQIATQLYQKANINITGFENLTAPDNFFDLAIGNVPFGQFGVHDPKFNKYKFDIHNYFFAKALDKVRPGGIVMFITTKGTMDNAGSSRRLRTYLNGKADLIGAIRLPDTAFRGNTGTNVISDIIVLKKRTDPTKADIHAKQWYDIEAKEIDGSIFYLNEYYINHPEMIAGELTSSIGRFSNRSINVSGKDIDLTKKLNEVIKNIPKDVYAPLNNPVKDSKQATMEYFAPNTIRDNSYTIGKAGTIYQNINGKLEEVPKSKQGVVRDFVNVKRKFKQLLSAQVDNKISDAAISKIRKDLNDVYDTFVKNNGYINDKKNVRALSDDPEYGMVSAIERYNEDKKTKKVTAEKSDIFKKRTVGLIEKPTKAESPSDALAISLRENGKVDIDYMANLIGKDKQEVVDNLKGVIYKEPMTGEFQTADEYLSGNVREKLVQAKEIAKTDSSYKNNVEALEKIQPVDLVPEEVTVNLGASWVPASDIEDFANNLLDMNGDYIEVEYLPANGEWVVKANDYVRKGVTFTETWGVGSRWPFDKLLEAALNQRSPKVMKSVGEKKSVVDNEATAAVNNMIDNIKKAFKDWIWTDDKRTKRLLDYYNTNFNNWKLREYDGSHLTLPGYSLVAPKLRKHQKDAVWRIMQNSNTLLAHSVGAGKTWTMQTAAMEMRRLGICKKPMFVIPGHMIQQFSNEFRQIYPSAQLLIVSAENLPEVTGKDKGMKKAQKLAQRQRLLTQIATEDWDGIIISHDMFKRIPMSPEATNGFYQEQADILEQAIREINAKESKSNVDTMALRNLQKSRINLINKLQRDVAEEKKDMVIPFEELGIDQIFVDEADLFKNLAFTTKLTRVAGLSNTGSQRSMDMYLKTRYITKSNGGRGVVFATGTPISNTLAEMYTMMRYLDEDNLRNNNLLYFDNWANQFVNITQTVERNPDGNGYRAVNKASAFVNRPEMVKMFRKFADVKRPEDLKLKVPKMKTGKRIVVSVEPSETLRDFITQDVKERAEKIRKRQVDPTEDNMLKLTGELRKASLDVRLINPNVSASQAGTKIAALTDNVYQEYKDSTATKGAQLIFCDLSTPAGISDKKTDTDLDTDNEADISNGNFNVYQEIKRQLIEKGIKQNEIAFIHDAKTREKKQQLFDAVNNGEIRILIGSTEKMGAGTNCQKKLVALHHLDCPWRPRDIEQREGRILRQGNENTEVGVYTYVTKDSFDANMWEKIKNKQHFITEALSADTSQRTIEDNDVLAMSFAEAEAIASGNPLMAEKVLTDAEVNKYMALKNAFDKKQARIRREVEQLPGKIASAKEIAKKAGMDAKVHKNISGDKFVMKIGNRTFTDRKKAQMALNKITEPIEKEQKTANVKIGEVAGFDLKARFMQTSTTLFGNKTKTSGEVILTLVNNWSYEAKNSVRSIEATANNMPQKIAETNEEFVRQATERQKALNKELGKNSLMRIN